MVNLKKIKNILENSNFHKKLSQFLFEIKNLDHEKAILSLYNLFISISG